MSDREAYSLWQDSRRPTKDTRGAGVKAKLDVCLQEWSGSCCLRDQDGGKIAAFLKNAWAKEPVLVVVPVIGRPDIIPPLLGPYTNPTVMIHQARLQLPAPSETMAMADVPATPDCQRPSLEWLKKLSISVDREETLPFGAPNKSVETNPSKKIISKSYHMTQQLHS